MSTISYLGPRDLTYGAQVAKDMKSRLRLSNTELVPEPNQVALLEKVIDGTSEHAGCVVAITNSLSPYGVDGVFELVIKSMISDQLRPNQLVACADMGISQCLLGLRGTVLHKVKTVIAHPAAAHQVREYIAKHMPEATIQGAASNGVAAENANNAKDPTTVAIGPDFAIAPGSDIEVLERGIDNDPNNRTQFLLIRNPETPDEIKVNTRVKAHGVILASELNNVPGSLIPLQSAIKSHGISVSGIRSMNSSKSQVQMIQSIYGYPKGYLSTLIEDMLAGCPGMEVSISRDGKKIPYDVPNFIDAVRRLHILGPSPYLNL